MQSMGTILDYLREYGDYTLWEKPFSDVDSLVLCQFAYLKFDGMVPGPGEGCCAVGVRELAEHVHYDHLYGDERYRKDNTALFQGIGDEAAEGRVHRRMGGVWLSEMCQRPTPH